MAPSSAHQSNKARHVVLGAAPNNSFKPNLLRSTKAMAEKACHGFGSTTQVGLTQALDHMNLEDWRVLARAVNRDVEMLTRASKTQDDVRSILKARRESPTEEQIIDADSFGASPGTPRTIVVAGSRLKIWKIHRADLNLSDVKGADLYYELGNRKFVLVQYKKSNSSDRVVLDGPQLEELKNACPVDCLPTNRFCCGSWYALYRKKKTAYFTACEIRELFGEYESRKADYFVNGLTQEQFLEEFGSCKIGARTRPVRAAAYQAFSVDNDHVVFRVKNEDPRHVV